MILKILFILFIGAFFFRLAEDYNKNTWLYAILGIASYYIGTFVSGFLIGLFFALLGGDTTSIGLDSNLVLALVIIFFGFLACWGFYRILKRSWEQQKASSENKIDQIGLEDDDKN